MIGISAVISHIVSHKWFETLFLNILANCAYDIGKSTGISLLSQKPAILAYEKELQALFYKSVDSCTINESICEYIKSRDFSKYEKQCLDYYINMSDTDLRIDPIFKDFVERVSSNPSFSLKVIIKNLHILRQQIDSVRSGLADLRNILDLEFDRLHAELSEIKADIEEVVQESKEILSEVVVLTESHKKLPDIISVSNEKYLNIIKDQINTDSGSIISIDRKEIIGRIEQDLKDCRHVLLSGEGGSGKSAVLKQLYSHTVHTFGWLIINAAKLDVPNINDAFASTGNYSVQDYLPLYREKQVRVLVIDSAERILDNKYKDGLFEAINSFISEGWSLFMICRSSQKSDLSYILNSYVSISCIDIELSVLSSEELDRLCADNGIQIPRNKSVKEKLRNLFFLTRYIGLPSTNTIDSLSDFYEDIWKYYIRGENKQGYNRASGLKREDCLITLARRRAENGTYYVSTNSVDAEVIYALTVDEILSEDDTGRINISHDLYEDMALYRHISNLYETVRDLQKFFMSIDDNLPTSRALKIWLRDVIDNNKVFADTISKQWIEGGIQKGNDSVLISIVQSDYSEIFFDRYDNELSNNDYKLFFSIVDSICLMSNEILAITHTKYGELPIIGSIGKGWEEAIKYAYKHKIFNRKAISKLLDSFSVSECTDDSVIHLAGLLALEPFYEYERTYKTSDYIYMHDAKVLAQRALKYSRGIKAELQEIASKTCQNSWIHHNDPFYGLTREMISDNNIALPFLSVMIPDTIINLCRVFWSGNIESSSRLVEQDAQFGINPELYYDYYPASALRTPLRFLFKVATDKTLQFIIQFVNDAIMHFVENSSASQISTVSFTLPDDTVNHVYSNYDLWGLYRNRSNISSNILLCIHMALESFLYNLASSDVHATKQILLQIMSESKSVSLVSIVASIISAFPNDFLDIASSLLSVPEFYLLDQHRGTMELVHSDMINVRRHKEIAQERRESSEMPHRKTTLEGLCLNLQFSLTGEDQQHLFDIIDNLKIKHDAMSDSADKEAFGYIIARMDYRSMSVEPCKLDGHAAVVLKPSLTKEQKDASLQVEKESQALSLPSRISLWVNSHVNKSSTHSNSAYDSDPLMALRDAIKLEKDNNPLARMMIISSDLVGTVSSVLLRFHYDILDDSTKDYCVDRVIYALKKDINIWHSVGSGFDIITLSISVLIKKQLLSENDSLSILERYILSSQYVDPNIPCKYRISKEIRDSGLWDSSDELMAKLLTRIDTICPHDNLSTVDIADSILSLLPIDGKHIELDKYAERAIEIIEPLFVSKQPGLPSDMIFFATESIVQYVLSSTPERAEKLLAPFFSMTSIENIDYLLDIMLSSVEKDSQKYDVFWHVWNKLFPSMISYLPYYGSNAFNSYLLQPSFSGALEKNWFLFDDRAVSFYRRFAEARRVDVPVITNIAKAFNTIGISFYREGIILIADILRDNEKLDFDANDVNNSFYIIQLIIKVKNELGQHLRNDHIMRDCVNVILDSLVNRGSRIAFLIKNEI